MLVRFNLHGAPRDFGGDKELPCSSISVNGGGKISLSYFVAVVTTVEPSM